VVRHRGPPVEEVGRCYFENKKILLGFSVFLMASENFQPIFQKKEERKTPPRALK
jgi:hypothetical protein